jgi:L-asparagine oxygenase
METLTPPRARATAAVTRLPGDIVRFDLGEAEVSALHASVDWLLASGTDPCDASFYDMGPEALSSAPKPLREFLHRFRREEPAGACIIRGFNVDDDRIGPTPAHWREAEAYRTRAEEMYVGLVSLCLGELFTWSTLQGARLIHNVLPIRGDENEQNGHGSITDLAWHTEDAFHGARCDYLILMGLRNEGRVPTTYSSIRETRISDAHRDLLFDPEFHVLPDDEHLRQLAKDYPDHPGLRRMQRMRTHPVPVSVLFGSPEQPYLRIDPFFMRVAPSASDAHREALAALIAELERARADVTLEPGDILVIDNYLAVHGRASFKANFDGRDRWLKKAVVSRNPRQSRQWRESVTSRILF